MVNSGWFFLLVVALACAPAIASAWWLARSAQRERRQERAVARMAEVYGGQDDPTGRGRRRDTR